MNELHPRPGVDPYLLAYLLLSPPVQEQLRNLGTGTSASHNRVKTGALRDVLLPMPCTGTGRHEQLVDAVARYREATQAVHMATSRLREIAVLREQLA